MVVRTTIPTLSPMQDEVFSHSFGKTNDVRRQSEKKGRNMALKPRFDHVGITVGDLEAVTSFFLKLGFEPDGGSQIVEGDFVSPD
jgi:hypothetical protein